MTIIRGTTPTIKYLFNIVDVSDMTDAILTVSQDGTVLIEKNISDASVEENALLFTLSQEDTLKLDEDIPGKIMLNWLLDDGTRGASNITVISIRENDVSEVI